MKTRKKLEKAGWVLLTNIGSISILGRVDKRVMYNSTDDKVYATYSTRELLFHPFSEYETKQLLK